MAEDEFSVRIQRFTGDRFSNLAHVVEMNPFPDTSTLEMIVGYAPEDDELLLRQFEEINPKPYRIVFPGDTRTWEFHALLTHIVSLEPMDAKMAAELVWKVVDALPSPLDLRIPASADAIPAGSEGETDASEQERLQEAPRPPMASTAELAEFLAVPKDTLSRWARLGTGPRYSRVGRHRRYRWSDVDAWLDANASK